MHRRSTNLPTLILSELLRFPFFKNNFSFYFPCFLTVLVERRGGGKGQHNLLLAWLESGLKNVME